MAANDMRLAGKRVLITGASSGIGLAAVSAFAREGATLALMARGREALDEAARESGAAVVAADVSNRKAVERAVERAVADLGGLDIVVSNAGAAVFGHFAEVHPDDFERTLDVTYTGAVNVIRAALPHLRRSRGTIVATGSLMTRVPLPTWSSYTAAKHALRGFLNSLAIEEREQRSGVRIAMVHPGPLDTPLFGHATSATGRKPRVPPDSYAAEVVAQALVEVAVKPRREVVLGGETLLMDKLFSVARPVAETALLLVDRWYRSGDEPAPRPGSLYAPTPGVAARGGTPSRASLLGPLQLGRRMLPPVDTPLRLASHLFTAGRKAIELSSALTSPVPEQPAPTRSARENGRPMRRRSAETVSL